MWVDLPLIGDTHADGANSITPVKTVFHARPTDEQYSDMPTRWDVYAFLKWRHQKLIIVGQRFISTLEKRGSIWMCKAFRLHIWEYEAVNRARLRRILYRRDVDAYLRMRCRTEALTDRKILLERELDDMDRQHHKGYQMAVRELAQARQTQHQFESECWERYATIVLRAIGFPQLAGDLAGFHSNWPEIVTRNLFVRVSRSTR